MKLFSPLCQNQITGLLIRSLLLLSISLSVQAQQQTITISDIRIGVSENNTRLVFDADNPVNYQSIKGADGRRLRLELPGTNFKRTPLSKEYFNSVISDISILPAAEGQPAIANIRLKKKTIISITPYAPDGEYGHRLVIDFIQLNKVRKLIPVVKPVKPIVKTNQQLFVEGQHALASGRYADALTIYQRLMKKAEPEVRQKAMEYYAVTLERSGKKARAKLEYQNYISQYPDTEGASRVMQRLNSMLSLEQDTRSLKTSKRQTASRQPRLETWGVLFEDYRWSQTVNNEGESDTRLSSAYSLADVNTRLRTSQYELSLRFNGGYEADFSDADDDQSRLSYLYLYGEHRATERSIKLGRQRQNNGGTIGRFDGVSVSSPVTSNSRVNFVAGYPVERSTNTDIDTERFFYGINADFGPFYDGLDFNLFFIDQTIDDLTDRRAVGGEIKYFGQNYYLSGYLDYDIFFNELNALLLNSRYQFEGGTNASLSLNFRKSPYLTTRNALIGQQVDDISDLRDSIAGIDELEELALDRTFDSTSVNIYIDHPINDDLNINTSLTVSELSDSPASAGVPGFEGSDTEYHLNSQLIADNWFLDQDTTYLGFSYANLTQADIFSVYSHYRYRISNNWRLYPRFAIQQRDNDNGTQQTRYSLLLRTEYQFWKNHRINGELGGDWYNNENTLGEDDQLQIYFFNLGYTFFF